MTYDVTPSPPSDAHACPPADPHPPCRASPDLPKLNLDEEDVVEAELCGTSTAAVAAATEASRLTTWALARGTECDLDAAGLEAVPLAAASGFGAVATAAPAHAATSAPGRDAH